MTSNYIMSIPVVSSLHLTPQDQETLAGGGKSTYPWPMRARYDEGWFVWMMGLDLIEHDPNDSKFEFSESFWECFRRHFKDADYADTIAIRFDDNADALDGIPTHGE